MTHFLQSPAWRTYQESIGRKALVDKGANWNYQAFIEIGRLNRRIYCPYGPIFSSVKNFDESIKSLKEQATANDIDFIRIEPTAGISKDQLIERGFKPVTYNQLQPEHTQIIDLSFSEDEIIAAMHQNNRNLYRNYTNKGLTIHSSDDPNDMSIFTNLMHIVAKRNGIRAHSDDYLIAQAMALFPIGAAKLFYVKNEDKPIAAAVIFTDKDTWYYAHAASDDKYRKLSAGTSLLAYIIVEAKRNGAKAFDLNGIAPADNPNHSWAGFTKFKKSFGGQSVSYVGTWDLPINRFTYYLYRIYQKLSR